MAVVVQVDPTPIPLAKAAADMACKPETLVKRFHSGTFPALRKIGGEWYVLPLLLVKMSNDGDADEGREIPGDVGQPGDREAGAVLQLRKRRRRGKAEDAEDQIPHPLETFRKTG